MGVEGYGATKAIIPTPTLLMIFLYVTQSLHLHSIHFHEIINVQKRHRATKPLKQSAEQFLLIHLFSNKMFLALRPTEFGLAIHQNDHQARRRFVEWTQNEIAVVPDFHKRIMFSDEAHFWLNGYVNKQNCRIWCEANPQVYVETPLHPEKLTVWCALWDGGILLQKR
ncbi:uncharacterized protein TNCV_4756841 [Trichonephila clavipes]|nr:uncharacterized protein TNCV_4756841 [Trichonephila clavipes]